MHIGIIMDGNGRWATAQGLPRLKGHAAGVETVRTIVRGCRELGVDAITLFAFAIANWKRDKEEVDGLWALFHAFIEKDLRELVHEGVCVRIIGNREGLPQDVREAAEKVEEESVGNNTFLLQVALNYDGVEEVARLIKRSITSGVSPDVINELYVREHLDTVPQQEPDIVIRTGMPTPERGMGIWRSSAFLPLQSVQSVCVSTETLWPDFTITHLKNIIAYADPDSRLFGGQRQ